jgi:hypothetical protein
MKICKKCNGQNVKYVERKSTFTDISYYYPCSCQIKNKVKIPLKLNNRLATKNRKLAKII